MFPVSAFLGMQQLRRKRFIGLPYTPGGIGGGFHRGVEGVLLGNGHACGRRVLLIKAIGGSLQRRVQVLLQSQHHGVQAFHPTGDTARFVHETRKHLLTQGLSGGVVIGRKRSDELDNFVLRTGHELFFRPRLARRLPVTVCRMYH